jgi:Fe2+ transport system protein FeoA
MTTLSTLAHDVSARIQGFAPGAEFTVSLMELGLVPGTTVRVIRSAPLGDPLEVDVTGARLALRRSVAAGVLVQPI